MYSGGYLINTIKNELLATFVSLRNIMYPTILCVNLPHGLSFQGEVHLQVHYKGSVILVLNYVLECNGPKNNTFLTPCQV
jgi:hypothetical protein